MKKNTRYPEQWPDIDPALYQRSVRWFRAIKSHLGVQLKLHADHQAVQGDIFLFNHFSRFETFIPQFLIFEKTGAFSCAIASGEFFHEENLLANYLKHVGVFPHDHPRLFPMLAGQILRGRKVIIFPEGGMVKDRRVIDRQGQYSIYSRIKGERRKQHTGPSVLGQGVDALKAAIRHGFSVNDYLRLQQWKEQLGFDSLDELMVAANKPTLIVPCNITFYPMRASENLLSRLAEWLNKDMSIRQAEELVVEGNILLKNTDMDIRMGDAIDPCCVWGWRTRWLMARTAPSFKSTDAVFALNTRPGSWLQKLLGLTLVSNAGCARNHYMEAMYALVTINLSHLASTLIVMMIEQAQTRIEKGRFYTVLYLAIKSLQKNPDIHLHESLLNPEDYGDLLSERNARFEEFIHTAKELELMAEMDDCYHFLPKLCEQSEFDRIRLENPIAVYNNEAAPVRQVREALEKANRDYQRIDPFKLAAWHLDDEHLALAFEQERYASLEFAEIKALETATANPAPFFLKPKKANGVGVLLIHGLLASPAELRDYGHYLAGQGYTVLGVRLPGHGTSPYALRDSAFEDWGHSVQRGFAVLKLHCPKVFLVGFSTGGALALNLAAQRHPEIVGVVAAAVPVRFANPAFMLVPLLHNANSLVHWVSSYEGIKPFLENDAEHPDINYHHVPVRALYELRRLIEHMESHLGEINCPVYLLQGDQDPIVALNSLEILKEKLLAATLATNILSANRHGVLMENLDDCWQKIDQFLQQAHLLKAQAVLPEP
ncbi:MAG: alpha/beta fold hydrolase [Methylococcales bacterium]|nr:alpha/beta fold hydrolase [Methylococcales bacterium]